MKTQLNQRVYYIKIKKNIRVVVLNVFITGFDEKLWSDIKRKRKKNS